MQSSLRRARWLVGYEASVGLACAVFLFLLLPSQLTGQSRAAAGSSAPAAGAVQSHDPMADSAFEHFYNMEYDRSIQEFEKVMERRPNDPAAVNHVLSAVLMRELY